MRPPNALVAITLAVSLGGTACGETLPYDSTVSVPEVEVRSGPSMKFYPTSKLRQGDHVKVLGEENDGAWLAIAPPPGSFSWINTRFLDLAGSKGIVHGDEVPLRVGSELTNDPPSVERLKVKGGTQVVVLDTRKAFADDGGWLPIACVPQEVRYIPKDAVRAPAPVMTVAANPPASPAAGAGSAPNPTGPVSDPLWQQAEQAERAGNMAEAIRLYELLSRQTPDHELAVRCYNRSYYLRQGYRGYTTPPTSTNAYYPGGAANPYGQNPYATWQPQSGAAASQYTYVKDGPRPPVPAQPASYGPPAAPPPPQSSGPGWLRRAPFWLDNKTTYVLESSQGLPRLYVTAQPGLDLEQYVNRTVDLSGPIVYRGDVKTYYMVATQATPAR